MSYLETSHPPSILPVTPLCAEALEKARRQTEHLNRLATTLNQHQLDLARLIGGIDLSVAENKRLHSQVAQLQAEKRLLLEQMSELTPQLETLQAEQKQLEHQLVETEEQTQQLFQLRTQISRRSSAARSSGFMAMSLLGGLDRHELLGMVHDMIISEVRQQHFALSNLYATNFRLYEALDRASILSGILETVVNLIGSEQVAVFEVDSDWTTLKLGSSYGIEPDAYRQIQLGSGHIGQVAATGVPFIGTNEDSPRVAWEEDLTACIPLKVNSDVIGVVAIFRLLPQKARFVELDYKLFELLTTHAAMALHCSTLYTNSQ
jgi:hypothetical protein